MTLTEAARPFTGPTKLYGCTFPKGWNRVMVELLLFRDDWKPEKGGLGKAGHFWNIVDILWGEHNPHHKVFIRTPWAEEMIDAACNNKYLAVAGCGSSGKSDAFAVWGIVSYLSDPEHTQVLVTSTSLKESRKRIWGKCRDYWQAMGPGFPGKLVDSNGVIRHPLKGDVCGITLVAGEQKKEKEAMAKLQGIKSSRDAAGEARLLLIADELAELSPSIPQVAFANLSRATPHFQFIGIANPNSYYDPFGEFAQPKDGWDSIHADMDEWETRYGKCIRFDAHKSPNILEGKEIYPFLPKQSDLDEASITLGPDSQAYWRMLRGFWSPSGNAESVYSEADIIKFGANKKAEWSQPPTKIIAIDPAFTSGGDRSVAYIGKVGVSKDGKKTLEFDRFEVLVDSVTNKDEPRNFQIARQFVDLCKREGVDPKNAAVDTTGGGPVFADIVEFIWKTNAFLRCCFGGSPSDRPMSSANKKKANEVCANRVTEIWVAGKELMRNEQLRGMGPDLIKELTARLYKDTKKSDGNAKVCVEPKKDMKARIGKSPDAADSAMILCDLARTRHGFAAQREGDTAENTLFSKSRTWTQKFRRMNAFRGVNLNG